MTEHKVEWCGPWWTVWVPAADPSTPVAVFRYADQAGLWAQRNYPGQHRIERTEGLPQHADCAGREAKL